MMNKLTAGSAALLALSAAPAAAFAASPAVSSGSSCSNAAAAAVPRAPRASRTAPRPRTSPRAAALLPPEAIQSASALALQLKGGAVGLGGAASLLPPVSTLAVALLTKQVAVALVVGIWTGAMLLCDLSPGAAFLRTFDTHLVRAIAEEGHATVILFNMVLGATIGLVQKGGGALGLAAALKRFAKDAQSCMATAATLAGLIFFDDYASILIVGNSFRPLLPLLGVCKERFACLVHFVAVSVSASMPVSSWVGLQVGAMSTATAGILASGATLPDPFVLTMRTLPYRLYPIAILGFCAALVATNKDFGPMADAVAASNQRRTLAGNPAAAQAAAQAAAPSGGGGGEVASDPLDRPISAVSAPTTTTGGGGGGEADGAVAAGPLTPKPGTPLRSRNALFPFGAIVGATLGGMVLDGRAKALAAGAAQVGLIEALTNGDSVKGLLWGSSTGLLTAMTLLIGQKILTLSEVMETVVEGMRDVLEPVMVLSLAWALGSIIEQTGTADFIARGLMAGGLPAWGLPAITTVLSYVISFATGSSFGTIGILFPLVGPLAWTLGGGDLNLLLHCFGAVYGGSLFGNMFSPIADTSILTTLATKVELQAHVTTAAPYACLVGGLCLLLGDLPIGLGLYGPLPALGLIMAAQTAVLSFFGKKPPARAPAKPAAA